MIGLLTFMATNAVIAAAVFPLIKDEPTIAEGGKLRFVDVVFVLAFFAVILSAGLAFEVWATGDPL
jgi:hypothetical protein